METITQPYHAHEVLNLIVNNPGKFSVQTLQDTVNQHMGPDAVFTNCSGRVFDTTQLVQFLTSRGKIILRDSKIFPVTDRICTH